MPLTVICAWCPDFDPMAPGNAGATHGMCHACVAKWMAEAARDVREDAQP